MPTAREDTTRLADLLRREHDALAEFLIALAAFDRDRRWVELGYSSLFYFLTRELGLSAGAAYYRKAAAELIQKFPEVIEPLRDGRLCFTSIVELSKSITPENRDTVLPRFFHVSKREAKAITAELQPVVDPPMRTVVTSVPAAALGSELPLAGPELHLDETAATAAPPAPAPKQRTAVEPLTAELTRIHITASRSLLYKLAVARDALSHSHPGATDDVILEIGLDLIVQRFLKRRGIGAKPRKKKAAATPEADAAPSAAPPPPRGRSRYVPPDVWREVWERDGGKCAFPLENGGVCGSTSRLELDHVEGFALGAGTTAEECRLCCDFHNDLSARDLFGDDLMNRYTRPKRGPGCSEPVAVWGAVARPHGRPPTCARGAAPLAPGHGRRPGPAHAGTAHRRGEAAPGGDPLPPRRQPVSAAPPPPPPRRPPPRGRRGTPRTPRCTPSPAPPPR